MRLGHYLVTPGAAYMGLDIALAQRPVPPYWCLSSDSVQIFQAKSLQVVQPAPEVKLVPYHKTLHDYARSNKILKDLCKCQFTFYCRGIISTSHIIFQLRKTTLTLFQFHVFLWCLALDVTADCICEIHCLALDGLYLNTVCNLSSKEKKSWRSRDLTLGLLGGKQ